MAYYLPVNKRHCQLCCRGPSESCLSVIYTIQCVLTLTSFPDKLINVIIFSKIFGGGSIQLSEEGILTKTKEQIKEYHFTKPDKEDGADVWKLIKCTGVLDLNSSYSYLMWCEIFSETSIVAKRDDKVVGFISGFIHPDSPDTLFIWQVAVNESERGKGLGTRMLFQLLGRSVCEEVHYVEATVSPSNKPSQSLFRGLAKKLDTSCDVSDYFSSKDFPQRGHEDELMFRIGPFENKPKMVKRMIL